MSNELIKYYIDKKNRKVAEFNGMKFIKEDSGYYKINNNWNEDIDNSYRLHRAVYEYYNGKIPKGLVVHHKDGNKENNDISNLELKTQKEHNKYHFDNCSEETKVKRRKVIEDRIIKAAIWHKTNPMSHIIHSIASKKGWNNKEYREVICQQCGKTFKTRGSRNNPKFCSGKCKNDYNLGYSLLDIESIEYIGEHDVYNMEVDKYHNYAIDGGIILHNCDSLRYYVKTIMGRRIEGRE